jgi:hypothetical protein
LAIHAAVGSCIALTNFNHLNLVKTSLQRECSRFYKWMLYRDSCGLHTPLQPLPPPHPAVIILVSCLSLIDEWVGPRRPTFFERLINQKSMEEKI